MQSLEQIFAKEFKQMTQERQAMSGVLDIRGIAVPKFACGIDSKRRILIKGIDDEFYGKLNDEPVVYWARPNLKRRKFGAGGAFLRDKNGNLIIEDVALPQGSVAVISKRRIGVPLKHKPSDDGLKYIDCVGKSESIKYIYTIPKKYCYLMKQCAFVISLTRLRNFYAGCSIVLQSGHTIYVHVIPYNPTKESHNYRVLATKTSCNFKDEYNQLMQFWIDNNIIFKTADTMLVEPINGSYSVSYREFPTSMTEFMSYDLEKSMAVTTEDLTDADIL